MRTSLRIPPEVRSTLLTEAALHHPNETGGVLLGHTTHSIIQVIHAIGPGPNAIHRRFNFTPDSDWQAEQVANLWSRDQTIEYLGDWHTHPNGAPKASALDRKTLRHIAASPQARQPQPIMLIIATRQHGPAAARAYQLTRPRIRTIAIAHPCSVIGLEPTEAPGKAHPENSP